MHSFLKQNPEPGSDRLLREAEGLEMLEQALAQAGIDELRLPARLGIDTDRLELERIVSHPPSETLMQTFGRGLAKLHSLRGNAYGLEHDNYIGLSPQSNSWYRSWGELFVDRRLLFQIERIRQEEIRKHFRSRLLASRQGLVEFLDRHVDGPAPVHGDLWSGNVLFDTQQVWLIDPAFYYGDPDVDLAMSEMFGGFSGAFYRAYHELRPQSPVYPLKRRIYNLYHYLNHYNLFGSSYLPGCEEGLAAIDEALHR